MKIYLFNFNKYGMKKNYVTAAFALLLLAGCSNEVKESDIIFSGEGGAKVSFSAVINDQEASNLVTRATETSWENGDRVGITCGSDQVNVEYQYSPDNSGLFNAVNGTTEDIWVLGTQTYDVSAYYPFTGTSGEEPLAVEVNTGTEVQTNKEARQQIDFLYATGTATSQQPNVQLSFHHVMSRIKLTFIPGEDVTLSDITCYLIGLKQVGTFNPVTGVAEVSADETVVAEDIIWDGDRKVGASENYTVEAILLPQTVSERVWIQAGMSGNYYEATFTNLTELRPGYSYNYTVEVNKYEDNEYTLRITEATEIVGWTTGDEAKYSPDAGLAGTDSSVTNPSWELEEEEID